MAHSSAIAAVGEAILALLKVSRPPEFSTVNNFELYNATSFKQPMTEGIALYLHRIVPANNIRNLPPRVAADGRRFKPSLPIDLHYLLIAFAGSAARQQRLLGWGGRTLEDTPLLSASLINQGAPPPAFGDTETIDVIMETLTIQDMGTVWEVAKPNIQPCLAYVVRMLTLDSEVEMIEAEAAQTRVFGMGAATP